MSINAAFISICIPAYKRPDLMQRLLESIAKQTFTDYEIVITDDTPGSEVHNIVKKFENLPIEYYKNNPAQGMPGNWNYVIAKATTSWIQLLHADDWYSAPDSLLQLTEACKNSGSSFIFCSSNEVNSEGRIIKITQLNEEKRLMLQEKPIHLVFDNVVGHPSTVVHKRDTGISYDTTFKWVVDIDFYIRYLSKHQPFHYISQPLINIGVDDEQVSSSSYKNPFVEIPEYLFLIQKFPEAIKEKNWFVFRCLWNLVKKFRIKDWSYIKAHGYDGPETNIVLFIIRYQKKIPRIILKQTNWSAIFVKKCFKKWLNNLADK
jgi:glycosyltransferase involved in cell wall biosynthesis